MNLTQLNEKSFFYRLFIKKSLISNLLNLFITALLFYFIILYTANKFPYYTLDWKGVFRYLPRILEGFKTTLLLSFFSLFLSVIIGIILYIGKNSKILFIKFFSTIYSEIIIGTPLLVQVIVIYYFVGTAFNINNRYVMGLLILSVFSGAFVSEIFKSGIDSIDKTQWEASTSLGFNSFQKYYYVIIPQVIRIILPPLAGQLSLLIKSSSLLSVIAVTEITKVMQEVDSRTFATAESYLILALGYLLLTYPISHFSKFLERKLAYGN